MVFGYARVSTEQQNLDMQIDALNKYGVDEIYSEKITGMKSDRLKLNELISKLRKGDIVVVYKLDRIGRSTKNLIQLVNKFNEMGVKFVSLHENLDTSSAAGTLIFNIFSSLAQFERDLISERTSAGLESARARGRNGGRPSKNSNSVKLALKMYNSKQYSIDEITKATGLSKTTLYRYMKKNV